jgi:hypothetical protein
MRVGIDIGPIVFQDAANKVHYFGEGLSDQEAILIVERMHARAPALRPSA